MKLCYKILAIVIIVATCAMITSCAGPTSNSYQNVSLTLTPYLICNSCFTGSFYYQIVPAGAGGIAGAIEIAAGGGSGQCIELQASVTNAPANFTWTILPTANPTVPAPGGTPNTGTLSSTTGNIVYYCEPVAIPIYTGAALVQAQALGIPQGYTQVQVSVPSDPNDPTKVLTQTLSFTAQLLNPPTGVLVGQNPSPTVVVPLGKTFQFTGYVAGINGLTVPQCLTGSGPASGLTYQVNTVDGGAGTGAGQFGTITSTGLYTAPAAYPSATVHTAAVTVKSTACPTIISTGTTITFP